MTTYWESAPGRVHLAELADGDLIEELLRSLELGHETEAAVLSSEVMRRGIEECAMAMAAARTADERRRLGA